MDGSKEFQLGGAMAIEDGPLAGYEGIFIVIPTVSWLELMRKNNQPLSRKPGEGFAFNAAMLGRSQRHRLTYLANHE